MTISERIASVINSEPEKGVMEWQGVWYTRGQLAKFAADFNAVLDAHGITGNMAVALAGRNRPSHCFAHLTILSQGRPISMLYAFQSAESLARDLTNTPFGAFVVDEQDFAPAVREAAEKAGTLVIVLRPLPTDGFAVVEPAKPIGEAAYRLPGTGIEILSSGTTGLPKRLFHPAERLFRSLAGKPPAPEGNPEIVMWPLSGIGGNMSLATAMIRGVGFILLEKFDAQLVAEATKRNRLAALPFTPTMVRMFLDANIPAHYMESLEHVIGGSGPLDPALIDQFYERYGKPIIWAMGATEFCGTIIAWNRELFEQYWAAKRGSSGKVLPGVTLRITDLESDEELPVNATGRLSAKVEAIGPDWIVTNDIAHIDEDGFVYFHGRADGAIVRGGFKIVPEKVCEVLRRHPAVAEAALIGIPDERLGEVPVAVIEPRPGQAPTAEELEQHVRAFLAAPQVPVRFILVDKLPYTASTKVAVGEVRKLVFDMLGIVDPKAAKQQGQAA